MLKRDDWLKQVQNYLEPSSDPELAKAEVMKPKEGFGLTFQLPYSSVSAFSDWDLNASDDDFLLIRVPEKNYETVHKVPWSNIHGVSITFGGSMQSKAAEVSRAMVMRQL